MSDRKILIKCVVCGGSKKMIEVFKDGNKKVRCEFCKDGYSEQTLIDPVRKTLVEMKEQSVRNQNFGLGVLIRDTINSYDKLMEIKRSANNDKRAKT